MLDHVGIEVSDYERSKAFYEAALAPLGIEPADGVPAGERPASAARPSIGPKPYFWIHVPRPPRRQRRPRRLRRRRSRRRRRLPRRRPRRRRHATTAPPARARSTTPATTAPSSSTPTATTSRPSATVRARDSGAQLPAAGTRRRGRPAGRRSLVSRSRTSPVTITWSPAAITSRRSQATQARASSIAGRPSRSLQATPAHFSATGALVAKARAIASWPAWRTLIAEAVGGLDGEQGAGAAVEAGEHQHRLDRERADRVGGRSGRARRRRWR